ncbi:hypothetical protein BDA99DRAFT_543058 [Phascolomyces articulosus]|uniref:Uncharacterized protein n=1 Tax=Phascolomyces articulosus TaxID=60185 RepID=A0AAD5JYV4_9FUNG|nr:hypothetical protein BDA99DRAFT_543058 [Phascolomyces articulosus]
MSMIPQYSLMLTDFGQRILHIDSNICSVYLVPFAISNLVGHYPQDNSFPFLNELVQCNNGVTLIPRNIGHFPLDVLSLLKFILLLIGTLSISFQCIEPYDGNEGTVFNKPTENTTSVIVKKISMGDVVMIIQGDEGTHNIGMDGDHQKWDG